MVEKQDDKGEERNCRSLDAGFNLSLPPAVLIFVAHFWASSFDASLLLLASVETKHLLLYLLDVLAIFLPDCPSGEAEGYFCAA